MFPLRFIHRHMRSVIGVTAIALCAVVIGGVIIPFWLINPHTDHIFDAADAAAIRNEHITVGLVLGAGITKEGKPYRELQARLDTAAQAFRAGQIKKILVSGDNRFDDYNEPRAMQRYL